MLPMHAASKVTGNTFHLTHIIIDTSFGARIQEEDGAVDI
jgi:hypothetical protein